MKGKLQKTLLMLFVCLGFLVMDVSVQAEERKELDGFHYINPMYEDVIPENESHESEAKGAIILEAPKLSQERKVAYYEDMEFLVDDLRSGMLRRDTEIELYFTQKGFLSDEWFNILVNEAMENQDYLEWNVTDIQIECEYRTSEASEPSSKTYNFTDIVVHVSYLTSAEQEEELKVLAAEVLKEIGAYSLSYDQRVEAIYNYICNNVAYDFENLENDSDLLKYSAYGALKNKKAVCQGYANLFYYLAKMGGLKVKIIGGISYDIPHAWNIVELGDVYYNVDATWDAGAETREYFLKGSDAFNKDHAAEEYYLTEEFTKKYPISKEDYKGQVIIASGTCGDNLAWILDDQDILQIFGTGDMPDWTSSSKTPWAAYKTSIKGVVFGEGITSIGENAFSDYSNLAKKIVFPETLVKIGDNAFKNCKQLTCEIVIPDSVSEIGDNAFYYTKITGIELSDSLKRVGNHAFEFCIYLSGQLNLPDSLEIIGDYAFDECRNLTGDLNLPKDLTYIGENAFYRCSGFTGDLIIPEGVESVGKNAFSSCGNLNGELVIPEGLTNIGESAFYNCAKLTGEIKLPEGMTTIPKGLFAYCKKLEGELILPKTLKAIEDKAFYNCASLTGALVIPEGVTSIGKSAFESCVNLSGELKIPASVTSIDERAFASCGGLNGELNFSDNITFLGQSAFMSCKGFTGTIKLPQNITSIEDGLFEGCTGFIGELVIPPNVTVIGYTAFKGCSGLIGELVIPPGVTVIESQAFSKCSGFTGELIIPESVTRIENDVFNDVNNIERVIVKNSKCTIGHLPLHATIVGYPDSTAAAFAKKYSRKFECIEHAYEWVVTKKATTSKEGSKKQVCSGCEKETGKTVIGIPKVQLEEKKFVYTGEEKIPVVSITDSEGIILAEGKDYKLSGDLSAESVGKYSLKVTYCGEYSGTQTLSYTVVPAKVTNFKAELSGGHDDVKLTWNKSTGASGYYVSYKKSSSSKYSSQKWTSKTSYTIKDLSDGVAYDFRVVPFYLKDDVKYYADSEYEYVSLKTLKNVKAPSTVSASPYVDYNDVKVTWSKSTGAAGYNVYYKEGTSGDYVFLTSTTKRNTTDAVDLKDGAKYTFKVVPYYTDGEETVESYYSKTKTIYILKQLDTPKVTKSSSKVKVQWNNISGESGYQISKSTSPTGTSIVSTYSTTSGKSKTISATKGKTYYYKVRAYKTVSGKKIPGPWSEVVEYTRK